MTLYHGDCIEVMRGLADNSVDLVVTSPPYDNLRTYKNTLNDWTEKKWQGILRELFRLIKDGGVCVWVVNDATINGSETGTSFKQALYAKECGFRLHDTMIWHKPNPMPTQRTRYEQSFEYVFVFSKGAPSSFTPLREASTNAGKSRAKHSKSSKDSRIQKPGSYCYSEKKLRHNIWRCAVSNSGVHPAAFPLQLATDHIVSWSRPGDVVLDPFMGSGTTGIACKKLGRDFIGIERDAEYFALAEARINNTPHQLEIAT